MTEVSPGSPGTIGSAGSAGRSGNADRDAAKAGPAADGLPQFVLPAKEGGWHLLVRVQPGAKKSEFAGVLDGRLRIRLAAPAVENKANKALAAFVAKMLGIRASQITLVSGECSRQKRLLVTVDQEPDWTPLLD